MGDNPWFDAFLWVYLFITASLSFNQALREGRVEEDKYAKEHIENLTKAIAGVEAMDLPRAVKDSVIASLEYDIKAFKEAIDGSSRNSESGRA